MAVEGVNYYAPTTQPNQTNQTKNKKSYAGYAALAGGVGGAAIGWNSRPYLKASGEYTDSFKNALKIVIEEDLKDGGKMISAEAKQACEELGKLTTVEEVKNFLSNNKIVKKLDALDKTSSVDNFVKSVKESGFKSSVDDLKRGLGVSDHILGTVDAFKLKSAAIYGGIGALVLGVGAYLFNKFRNNS